MPYIKCAYCNTQIPSHSYFIEVRAAVEPPYLDPPAKFHDLVCYAKHHGYALVKK